MDFFRGVMSYNRFALINQFFHLNNNANAAPKGKDGFDSWHKIRPLLNHMYDRFKHHFIPEHWISIDKSMVGMKNCNTYSVHAKPKNKRHSWFGITKFQLSEAKLGYAMHVDL